MREQLDKAEGGREDDVEGLEEGLRDGVSPAGGSTGCLPSTRLACRLSADWKTCQVTLAPPTYPPTHSTTPELETPPLTKLILWRLTFCAARLTPKCKRSIWPDLAIRKNLPPAPVECS